MACTESTVGWLSNTVDSTADVPITLRPYWSHRIVEAGSLSSALRNTSNLSKNLGTFDVNDGPSTGLASGSPSYAREDQWKCLRRGSCDMQNSVCSNLRHSRLIRAPCTNGFEFAYNTKAFDGRSSSSPTLAFARRL